MEISALDQAQKLLKMVDLLDDCDDVQNVTGNYSFSKEVAKNIA